MHPPPKLPSADAQERQLQTLLGDLRLRDLELLCEIAGMGSLSSSAERLGITQPAASRLLSGIERTLGLHVFERRRGAGMQPTAGGALVIARAQAVLADMRTLSGELVSLRAGRVGDLRIGVIPYVSQGLLRDLVQALASPGLQRVMIAEGETQWLVQSLRAERLDAVLARCGAATVADDLEQTPLFTQRACIVCHPDSALLRAPMVEPATLLDYRWVLPPRNSPSRIAFDDAFLGAQLNPPSPMVETASLRLIQSLLTADSRLLALAPAAVGRDLEQLGPLRSVPVPMTLNLPPVGLICLRRHAQSPAVVRVRDTLRSLVARGLPLD